MTRFFGYTKRNIRRTPYQALAASMVMFLTFIAMLLFVLLALGTDKIVQTFENKPQVLAFFKPGTTPQDINAIQTALEQTGKVTSIDYISKDKAFQIYSEKNKDKPQLVEFVTPNVLPESIEVSASSPNDLEAIATMLGREPVVSDVAYPRDVIEKLIRTGQIIRFVGLIVICFLILFSFLIILMVIGFKIRVKRTEIEIMKLLGASTWFIRIPFILEGIAYGLAGAFAAWIGSYIILWYLTPFVQKNITEIPLLPVSPLLMLMLLAVASGVAIAIGFLGSYGALRRYLKL